MVAIVVGAVFVGLPVLAIVCIAAVTFLGRSASVKFSSIGRPIGGPNDPSYPLPTTTPTTAKRSTSSAWTKWTAPDGSFSIDLPGTPDLTASTPDGTHRVDRAEHIDRDGMVALSWTDLGERSPSQFLEAETKRVSRGIAGATTTDLMVGNCLTRRISGTDDIGLREAIVIACGTRGYTLEASGSGAPTDLARALASFTGVR